MEKMQALENSGALKRGSYRPRRKDPKNLGIIFDDPSGRSFDQIGMDDGPHDGNTGGPYVTKAEFTDFKNNITNRFDSLLKGYGKLEGKFDAFNQIWRQELEDIKSQIDDVKTEVKEQIDGVNKNIDNRFTRLENMIKALVPHEISNS